MLLLTCFQPMEPCGGAVAAVSLRHEGLGLMADGGRTQTVGFEAGGASLQCVARQGTSKGRISHSRC